MRPAKSFGWQRATAAVICTLLVGYSLLGRAQSGAESHGSNADPVGSQQRGWLWSALGGITIALLGTSYFLLRLRRSRATLFRLNRELRAISSCHQTMMRAENEQSLLNTVCQLVCQEAGYRMVWVAYAEAGQVETMRPVAWSGAVDGRFDPATSDPTGGELGFGLAVVAIRSGARACIQDLADDPALASWQGVALKRGYRSCLSLPLSEGNTTFGALTIYSAEANVFTSDEVRLLDELARDLAFGIAVLRARIVRAETEEALRESQQEFRGLVENSPDVIVRYDREGRRIYVNPQFERVNHILAKDVLGKTPAELSTRLKPLAALFTERLMAAMASRTVAKIDLTWSDQGKPICWFVRVVPEFDAEGQVVSALTIWSDITERKLAEQEIEQLAFYDSLTKLPNRRLLVDRLHQALASSARSRRKGALLFIDLDNFKTLNDTSGHDVGDRLLIEVAHRLTTCVRDDDTIARFGGDEFIVVLEDLSENAQEAAAQAKAVGEKILSVLSQAYSIAGRTHHSTPSVGVTLFIEADESVDELLKQADIAMYQAKAAGRNMLRFFDPEMQAALAARTVMEAALRLAVLERQLVLYYQPQVDDRRGVIGAEALVRWQHPERGIVAPAQFIPLAEETGLILSIGQWVLETACARLRDWALDANFRHLDLAVNVSARQFRQADFVDQVRYALQNSAAPAERLKLELTESLVLDDVGDTIDKMHALRRLGVGFSIDDFGTGYSSLAYLTRLPLDQLKIDRSFVRNLPGNTNDAVVTQSIITLASSLGLSVIAEGVETEAQRDFLIQHGCPTCQGYLFSWPLDLAAFEQFLLPARA